MSEDEKYLRSLDYPQDLWVLGGQQWYTALEVARQLGISDEGARRLAQMGSIPGAVMHDAKRIGWRFPREGLINYLASLHRKEEQRRRDSTAS
jgi:hypothetical protein